jgi:hypothetical protein
MQDSDVREISYLLGGSELGGHYELIEDAIK